MSGKGYIRDFRDRAEAFLAQYDLGEEEAKEIEDFFAKEVYASYHNGERDRKDLQTVLEKTRTTGTVDVHVNVVGGGFTGQSGAIVLGLARALNRYDPTLEPILRDNNFLTRDPRRVERKKYGQPGARARFQFSKR